MEKGHYPPYDTFLQKKDVQETEQKTKCVHTVTYYLQILLSNMGIFALLIGYMLLGSFVFLMIEGRQGLDGKLVGGKPVKNDSATMTDDFRTRTVENIWEITVSLNILYRENWTRLAGQEISRFQEELVQKMAEDIVAGRNEKAQLMEWNFSRAFLYSLTVLTTIGYGGFSPRTSLGKMVTILYAVIGIPLMLLYLYSVGSVLSRCARGVCSRTLCCCLCSNCGYCCYDESRMQEKEKRMKRRRELEEMQQRQLQEPFYVRSCSSGSEFPTTTTSSVAEASKEADEEWKMKGTGSILAPLGLCVIIMMGYIMVGSVLLIKLEAWPFLDCCYFCFMSLTTINLSDVLVFKRNIKNTTIWLCSIYILTGLALTAMCFNILHEELLKGLKKQLINGITVKKQLAIKKSPGLMEETGPDLYSSS